MSRIEVVKFRRRDADSWYTSYVPAKGASPVRATTHTANEVEAERVRLELERKVNRDAFHEGGDRFCEIAAAYIDRQRALNTHRAWASALISSASSRAGSMPIPPPPPAGFTSTG